MIDFNFQTTPRIICQQGGAANLGKMAADLGIKRPVVVTDAGLLKTGTLQPVLDSLTAAGAAVAVFSEVLADPPEERVLQAVRFARQHNADGIIGLGGGSSMDTAKLVALLARTEQAIGTIYGIGLARGPRLALIQVPTTAGTGSEVTPIAIVTTPTQEKKGVVSPWLYADLALLDADLTLGLPPAGTAMTGVDAMVHAIEAFATRRLKNPISDALAVQALAMLHANIHQVVDNGANREARALMLQGSMLAGIAFANTSTAAVHALAYPIGGHHHVPHGLSNSLVLIPTLRFNAPVAEKLYARLGEVILPQRRFASSAEACHAFIDEMAAVVAAMPFAHRLREVGIREDGLALLADDAIKVTRLLVNNPREVTRDDALAIYRAAW